MTFEQMEFIGDDWNTVWDQMFCDHSFISTDEAGSPVETDRCVYCGIRKAHVQEADDGRKVS
jgi:hypothetical protein